METMALLLSGMFFTNNAVITVIGYVALVVGLICCIVEILLPGIGIFGVIGGIGIVAGLVLRIVDEATFLEIFVIIMSNTLVFTLVFWIFSRSAKKGRLSKSPIVLSESAVSEGITAGTKDFSYLLGVKGKTLTMLRPMGKAEIENETFDVSSESSGIIDKGKDIVVVGVEGQIIKVKAID